MNDDLPPGFEAFFKAMNEGAAWAGLRHSLEDVAKDNPVIVAELEQFEKIGTVALLASLLTLPAHQSECIRFELLVALALIHCKGENVATLDDAARWRALIGKSNSVIGEDPSEDVFTSPVGTDKGDHLLLEGVWEAAGFYTQCMVDVVSGMPDAGIYRPVRRSVEALLRLSNLVCERADLHRFETGSDMPQATIETNGANAEVLKARMVFSAKELKSGRIAVGDLAPFLLDAAQLDALITDMPGAGTLEQRPLLRTKDGIVVVLPTALSIALRHAVIHFASRFGQIPELDRALANAYRQAISQTRMFGDMHGVVLRWQPHGQVHIAVVVVEVDVGHFMVVQFVLPSTEMHLEAGFTGFIRLDDETAIYIDQVVTTIAKKVSDQPGFQRGMVVRVGCGWGAGFLGSNDAVPGAPWQFEWISAADLFRIGALPRMSPLAFWRIKDAEETIRKAGVQIHNLNGVLNLLGWVRANDGHMVPHERLPEGRISPDRPLVLTIPTNLLRDVRIAADNAWDRHRLRDNNGRLHRVMRPSPENLFQTERQEKFYASLDDLDHRKLTGVYEGASNLWGTLETPNMEDKHLIFELWKMVCLWIGRVGTILSEAYGDKAAGKSVKVYVQFVDSDDISPPGNAPSPTDLDTLWRLERISEQRAIRIVFAGGFLAGFAAPDNRAERIVARSLGSAFGLLLRLGDHEEIGNLIEGMAVPNDQARNFHLMQSNNFSDRFPASIERPLLAIEDVESGAARIELGWKAVAADAPTRYEGKEAVGTLLKKVVDVLVQEITEELATFDRRATLIRLLENCERARSEENHWHRTAAALLGLHEEEPGAKDTIAREMSRFAGASVTSRLVVEIAICACPLVGGIKPSDMALTRLLARIALLYQIGGLSDAIYYSVLPAEVVISPLGDILFRNDLGEMVLEPMLARATNERFESYAAQSHKHYAPLDTPPAQEANLDTSGAPVLNERTQEFMKIWFAEMGFSVEDGLRFIDGVEATGIQKGSAIFPMSRNELMAVGLVQGLDEKTVEAFLQQFVLAARPTWEDVPKGFKKADIYPWRFGRRLSLIARPLLQIDTSDNPTMLVVPGLLRTSLHYVLDGAYTGRLSRGFFRTPERWDRWLSEARDGHVFERTLADALTAAGWVTRVDIGFHEILGRKLGFEPGKIDVLAWRHDRSDVLIIECKDLSLTRNYSEAASQLSEYQGKGAGGRADKLKKHLDRMELARANLKDFARFTSVANPELISWLVFKGVSPVHYAKIPALKGTHVGRQEDILAF